MLLCCVFQSPPHVHTPLPNVRATLGGAANAFMYRRSADEVTCNILPAFLLTIYIAWTLLLYCKCQSPHALRAALRNNEKGLWGCQRTHRNADRLTNIFILPVTMSISTNNLVGAQTDKLVGAQSCWSADQQAGWSAELKSSVPVIKPI